MGYSVFFRAHHALVRIPLLRHCRPGMFQSAFPFVLASEDPFLIQRPALASGLITRTAKSSPRIGGVRAFIRRPSESFLRFPVRQKHRHITPQIKRAEFPLRFSYVPDRASHVFQDQWRSQLLCDFLASPPNISIGRDVIPQVPTPLERE